MATLVVPGVKVEARFDILPPLPASAGILGVVGVVDRVPANGGLVGVTKAGEVHELLGAGTEITMPEVFQALANGMSEVIISPVSGGEFANLTLSGVTNNTLLLKCRCRGDWGNRLSAEVKVISTSSGNPDRVSLYLRLDGYPDESYENKQIGDLVESINSTSRFVVALDASLKDQVPDEGEFPFTDGQIDVTTTVSNTKRTLFTLKPGEGVDATSIKVKITVNNTNHKISISVNRNNDPHPLETFTNLEMNPDSASYLLDILRSKSRYLQIVLPALSNGLPKAVGPTSFTSGDSPSDRDYNIAIDLLRDKLRIDMVLASIDPYRKDLDAATRKIHQSLLNHAIEMADKGAPRIAFGSVTKNEQNDMDKIKAHAAALRHRRFVLVSPSGAEGAVAGRIAGLNPQDAPTFKTVPLFSIPPASYRESELNNLLSSEYNLLVVQERIGRGIVVLKGIDLTGDQISVTRVADQAIRETKAISENFIGQLNSEDTRVALKQQIYATFLRMERDGALVPSTDGKEPAFLVDVYSTQLDFGQGIVRVDIAVRPVRSIDYIYATIKVKNN